MPRHNPGPAPTRVPPAAPPPPSESDTHGHSSTLPRPAQSRGSRLRAPPPPPPISFCGHRGVLHTARVGGRPPRFLDAPSRFRCALYHVLNAAPPNHCGRLRRLSAPITVYLLSLSLPSTHPSPQRTISQPSTLPRLAGHVAPAPLSRCLRACVVVPPRRTHGRHHAHSRDGGRCPLCPPRHHRPLLWRQPWAVLSTPTPTTAFGAAVWIGRRQLDDPHVRSGACGVPPSRGGREEFPAAARLRACPAATTRVNTRYVGHPAAAAAAAFAADATLWRAAAVELAAPGTIVATELGRRHRRRLPTCPAAAAAALRRWCARVRGRPPPSSSSRKCRPAGAAPTVAPRGGDAWRQLRLTVWSGAGLPAAPAPDAAGGRRGRGRVVDIALCAIAAATGAVDHTRIRVLVAAAVRECAGGGI